MYPKKKAITAAVTGTALGIAGLAVIAMPASAGAAPVLPTVSAEDLVQSVATAKTPALSGTVRKTTATPDRDLRARMSNWSSVRALTSRTR